MNNKYKILLVEDEQNISTLVMTMLETAGYQVIPAKTCAMAKTLFISYCPDLVISGSWSAGYGWHDIS